MRARGSMETSTAYLYNYIHVKYIQLAKVGKKVLAIYSQ